MGHIHTEPGQHDSTVSACIVYEQDGKEPQMLLHMHKKLGIWLQFGGHIELHENPWQAVSHEIAEESGYDISQLEILQPKLRIKSLPGAVLHPQPVCVNTHRIGDEHAHSDLLYAFVTNQRPQLALSDDESNEIAYFTLQGIKDIPQAEITEDARQIIIFVMESLLSDWERVNTQDYNG